MKLLINTSKFLTTILFVTLLNFPLLSKADQGGHEESEDPMDDSCDCRTETAFGNSISDIQLDINVDSSFCTGEDAFIHFVNPNSYLDSFPTCAYDSLFHKLHFAFGQTPTQYQQIYESTNGLPDSINFTDLILNIAPAFYDIMCSSSSNYIILSYSFVQYDSVGAHRDSCTNEVTVYFTCTDSYDLNANIIKIPSTSTSCEPIQLLTNYSSGGSTHFEWYSNPWPGTLLSDDITVFISDPNTSTVAAILTDTNFATCEIGHDTVITSVNYIGFEAEITSTSSTNFNCSDPTVYLNLPSLFLVDSGSFSNHTFQWYDIENGITSLLTGQTFAQLNDVEPGHGYNLVVTDTTTTCTYTTDYIYITGISEQQYELSLLNGNQICIDSASPELSFSPALPYPLPNGTIVDVYVDGVSQGNDFNVYQEGEYYVEFEFPGGCRPFTDTLIVDIDSSICEFDIVTSPKEIICITDPVALINRGPKSQLVTYEWSFPGADLTSYTGYYPPMINYASSGNYTVTLIVSSGTQIDTLTKTISVSANCCERDYGINEGSTIESSTLGEENEITVYTGGETFDGDYHVLGTIVLKNGTYYINDGSSFFIDGECEECDYLESIEKECDNFEIDLTQIVVDSATLYIGDAEFRATCDKMWYGISFVNGSYLNSLNDTSGQNGMIKDALAGITICDPGGDFTDIYYIDQFSFLNNVIGINDLDESEANFNFIKNSHFDVKDSLMLYPYANSIGLSGINISSLRYIDDFSNNFIGNSRYSIYHKLIGDPNASYHIKNSTFRNFHIAGLAVGGGDQISEVIDNEFQFIENPVYHTSNPFPDYPNYSGAISRYPNVDAFPCTGESCDEMDRDHIIGALLTGKLHFYRNEFMGSNSNLTNNSHVGTYLGAIFGTTPSENSIRENNFDDLGIGIRHSYAGKSIIDNSFTNSEIGIKIPISSSENDYFIEENEFIENESAIEVGQFTSELTLQENLFLDNDTSISVLHDNNSNPLNIVMNCNSFELDNVESYNRYGLVIHSNADIMDIGGNNPSQGLFPSGNGWPVDPASTGYSTCTTPGASIDVTQWSEPINWIPLEDNSSSTWKYYAYHNEFTGSIPGNKLFRMGQGNNAPTCSEQSICFPLSRLVQSLDGELESNILSIYPNPASNLVIIDGVDSKEIDKVVLVDMSLREYIVSYGTVRGGISINIERIRPGFYMLMVRNKMGNYRIGKLLVE